MTRPLLSLALVVAAIALGSVVPTSSEGRGLSPTVIALRGTPVSFPGSDPAGYRGDGGSIPRAIPAGVPTGSVGSALRGWISWADPDLGGDYLATRFPRGTLVRICALQCLIRRTNDFGPSAKIDPPRIADLAVLDWEAISGLPRSRGLVRGTVEAIGEIALPATDTR